MTEGSVGVVAMDHPGNLLSCTIRLEGFPQIAVLTCAIVGLSQLSVNLARTTSANADLVRGPKGFYTCGEGNVWHGGGGSNACSLKAGKTFVALLFHPRRCREPGVGCWPKTSFKSGADGPHTARNLYGQIGVLREDRCTTFTPTPS